MDYGITIRTPAPFGEAVARVRDALKAQGFGVLTEIDVQATLRDKLGEEMEPYLILGDDRRRGRGIAAAGRRRGGQPAPGGACLAARQPPGTLSSCAGRVSISRGAGVVSGASARSACRAGARWPTRTSGGRRTGERFRASRRAGSCRRRGAGRTKPRHADAGGNGGWPAPGCWPPPARCTSTCT